MYDFETASDVIRIILICSAFVTAGSIFINIFRWITRV